MNAILLLGPTGVGKTPLGDYLAEHGLAGRRCVHFDFGAQLRAAAASSGPPCDLTDQDVAFIREVLGAGALLENETFYIAERLLDGFLCAQRLQDDDGLVALNGLPRHVGQANDVDCLVQVQTVISLTATPSVVHERIRLDSGGDRAVRTDDSTAEIEAKLAIYRTRTEPLVAHYRQRGAKIRMITVEVGTGPRDIVSALESAE